LGLQIFLLYFLFTAQAAVLLVRLQKAPHPGFNLISFSSLPIPFVAFGILACLAAVSAIARFFVTN
jgi:hypothetical protein